MVMVADPTLIVYPFINHLVLVCSEYVYMCVFISTRCVKHVQYVLREN